MRKLILTLFVGCAAYANACTNFIVGKGASADGSVICTYNADDYGMFQSLCHYPAAKHAPGEMRRVVDWDTNKYHGDIPEAAETYNVIGNINEYQVTIGETTYGGREEMVDSTGILDYGSLIYIALQRSKTAREAISVMTTLVETYGYNSEGETFTICDPNEAWIMEMMGMGPGSKSAVWVALRIPDDAICAHANQSRITKFDMKDKKNVLFSKNVVKYAKKMGWFAGKDADFSWNEAYAKPDFSGRRYCFIRIQGIRELIGFRSFDLFEFVFMAIDSIGKHCLAVFHDDFGWLDIAYYFNKFAFLRLDFRLCCFSFLSDKVCSFWHIQDKFLVFVGLGCLENIGEVFSIGDLIFLVSRVSLECKFAGYQDSHIFSGCLVFNREDGTVEENIMVIFIDLVDFQIQTAFFIDDSFHGDCNGFFGRVFIVLKGEGMLFLIKDEANIRRKFFQIVTANREIELFDILSVFIDMHQAN